MSSLDRLAPYLRGSHTLRFPQMALRAGDHDPLIAVGEGDYEIVSETEFRFKLAGVPVDLATTLRELNRQREERYDPRRRFRLEMTDTQGQTWSGGHTLPSVDTDDVPWIFSGSCGGLMTDFVGEASPQGGAEARFLIPAGFSARSVLSRFVQTVDAEGVRQPRRTITVLDSEVTFSFDSQAGVLTLSAPSTPGLPAHAAENWMGEPLRILFGQLVYPRLVERRFSDGRAMLSLRTSPSWTVASSWVALWAGHASLTDADGFFELYRNLLTMIARTGDWGAHTVTSFYQEVIQATLGSRWVWFMTLASSIEGVAKLLTPASTLRPDADAEAIEGLVEHIEKWDGPSRLADAAIGFVRRLDTVSVNRALLDLADRGVGSRDEVKSWQSVRNRVMHGELVSPYTSREDDKVLVDLASLLRALTREAARCGRADGATPAS